MSMLQLFDQQATFVLARFLTSCWHEVAAKGDFRRRDLARALIEARAAAGLSQSQLAKKMKTSQSYIARIEGGKSTTLDGCVGALRSSDPHAPSDHLRT